MNNPIRRRSFGFCNPRLSSHGITSISLIFECARAKMARKSWYLLHRSCWVGPGIETLRTSPRMEVPLNTTCLTKAVNRTKICKIKIIKSIKDYFLTWYQNKKNLKKLAFSVSIEGMTLPPNIYTCGVKKIRQLSWKCYVTEKLVWQQDNRRPQWL